MSEWRPYKPWKGGNGDVGLGMFLGAAAAGGVAGPSVILLAMWSAVSRYVI